MQNGEHTIASTQEVVRELTQRTIELAGLLRSQQDILRKRGMNLPFKGRRKGKSPLRGEFKNFR